MKTLFRAIALLIVIYSILFYHLFLKIEVSGLARNSKTCAVILDENGEHYMIKNVDDWYSLGANYNDEVVVSGRMAIFNFPYYYRIHPCIILHKYEIKKRAIEIKNNS